MAEPTHSPYNFVPLPETGPERGNYPGLDRIGKDSYSGVLTCDLEVLTRLFTADHQRAGRWAEGDERDDRKVFPFLRDSRGTVILQASSLKGMIRAVFEAAFPSCLPLAAAVGDVKKSRTEKVPYQLALPPGYDHKACDRVDRLCPACRLFGIAQGEDVHAQGRVVFSDATLSSGSLQEEEIKLAELSSPKPYHYEIYSSDGGPGGAIRGRKFYYHHNPIGQPAVENLGRRANAIREFAPPGTCFTFQVRFENLSEEELRRLISCLVLDSTHAHKLGMAKPLGYGSCKIEIRKAESFLEQGASRYLKLQRSKPPFETSAWTLSGPWLTGALEELLRREREDLGPVGYLPYGRYRGTGIDEQGRYREVRSGAPRRRIERPTPQAQEPASTGFSGVLQPTAPPKASPPRPRTKVMLEVLKYEGGIYTLRDPETGQEDIKYTATGVRWRVGDRVKVRIVKTTKDGRIKEVQPG